MATAATGLSTISVNVGPVPPAVASTGALLPAVAAQPNEAVAAQVARMVAAKESEVKDGKAHAIAPLSGTFAQAIQTIKDLVGSGVEPLKPEVDAVIASAKEAQELIEKAQHEFNAIVIKVRAALDTCKEIECNYRFVEHIGYKHLHSNDHPQSNVRAVRALVDQLDGFTRQLNQAKQLVSLTTHNCEMLVSGNPTYAMALNTIGQQIAATRNLVSFTSQLHAIEKEAHTQSKRAVQVKVHCEHWLKDKYDDIATLTDGKGKIIHQSDPVVLISQMSFRGCIFMAKITQELLDAEVMSRTFKATPLHFPEKFAKEKEKVAVCREHLNQIFTTSTHIVERYSPANAAASIDLKGMAAAINSATADFVGMAAPIPALVEEVKKIKAATEELVRRIGVIPDANTDLQGMAVLISHLLEHVRKIKAALEDFKGKATGMRTLVDQANKIEAAAANFESMASSIPPIAQHANRMKEMQADLQRIAASIPLLVEKAKVVKMEARHEVEAMQKYFFTIRATLRLEVPVLTANAQKIRDQILQVSTDAFKFAIPATSPKPEAKLQRRRASIAIDPVTAFRKTIKECCTKATMLVDEASKLSDEITHQFRDLLNPPKGQSGALLTLHEIEQLQELQEKVEAQKKVEKDANKFLVDAQEALNKLKIDFKTNNGAAAGSPVATTPKAAGLAVDIASTASGMPLSIDPALSPKAGAGLPLAVSPAASAKPLSIDPALSPKPGIGTGAATQTASATPMGMAVRNPSSPISGAAGDFASTTMGKAGAAGIQPSTTPKPSPAPDAAAFMATANKAGQTGVTALVAGAESEAKAAAQAHNEPKERNPFRAATIQFRRAAIDLQFKRDKLAEDMARFALQFPNTSKAAPYMEIENKYNALREHIFMLIKQFEIANAIYREVTQCKSTLMDAYAADCKAKILAVKVRLLQAKEIVAKLLTELDTQLKCMAEEESGKVTGTFKAEKAEYDRRREEAYIIEAQLFEPFGKILKQINILFRKFDMNEILETIDTLPSQIDKFQGQMNGLSYRCELTAESVKDYRAMSEKALAMRKEALDFRKQVISWVKKAIIAYKDELKITAEGMLKRMEGIRIGIGTEPDKLSHMALIEAAQQDLVEKMRVANNCMKVLTINFNHFRLEELPVEYVSKIAIELIDDLNEIENVRQSQTDFTKCCMQL